MNKQSPTASKIAALNDEFRKTGRGSGRIMLTAGIQALGEAGVNAVLAKVRAFNTFTVDNDPYGERDFGKIEHGGDKIFFKFDYYDRQMQYASPDPADASKTCRILTIMLAEEY